MLTPLFLMLRYDFENFAFLDTLISVLLLSRQKVKLFPKYEFRGSRKCKVTICEVKLVQHLQPSDARGLKEYCKWF